MRYRLLALAVVLGLLAVACGGNTRTLPLPSPTPTTTPPVSPSPTESPTLPPSPSPVSPSPTTLPSPSPSPSPSVTPGDTETRPNILIILTDDQRQLPLEVLRAVMPVTMHWFKDHGTYFPNAFATTPLCCPSRASLMTGQYAHNTGVRTNVRAPEAFAPRQDETIQYYLHEAGYRTGFVGKYLNHWDLTEPPPHFDTWMIAESDTNRTAYYGRRFSVNGNMVATSRSRYSTDVLAGYAMRYLANTEQRDERPWFLEIATNAPHNPFIPKREYALADVPDYYGSQPLGTQDRGDGSLIYNYRQTNPQAMAETSQSQLRMLMSVDDLVDDVFALLRQQGEFENTLVVFASDNGYLWGEHNLAGKGRPFTESVNVPLFLRWPGHIAKGAVDERLVAILDIAPTILEAANITPEPKPSLDGHSLLGTTARERILLEYWARDRNRLKPSWLSMRTKTFQYVVYYGAPGRVLSREYYNLVSDPYQTRNLLADKNLANDPDIATLDALLLQDLSCRGSACP